MTEIVVASFLLFTMINVSEVYPNNYFHIQVYAKGFTKYKYGILTRKFRQTYFSKLKTLTHDEELKP